MTDLPAPLTPADCDLRGYEFMPLFGDVLFASATWISAKPEAKVAALRLWWHAYAKEVPAASLPDDDTLLSEYAGYGVAVASWRKVRAAALRGWFKCSDGRLYHKTVAKIALESWSGRKENRAENDRKRKEREDRSRLFADLAERGVTPPWNIKTGDLRDLHRKHVTATGHGDGVTGGVTGDADVTAREGEDRESKDKALRASVERVFDALWAEWPDVARKRHTKPDCRDAIRRQIRDGGDPDAIIAAGKAHVAERISKPETVKGIVRWLANGLWKNWAPAEGAKPETADWAFRLDYWRTERAWPAQWGPNPTEPGFLGPKTEDLFAQGATP